jgi:hypothetical protein
VNAYGSLPQAGVMSPVTTRSRDSRGPVELLRLPAAAASEKPPCCTEPALASGQSLKANRTPDPSEVDEWIRCYELGESYERIAAMCGFGTMTVRKYVRARGFGRTTGEANHQVFRRRHADVVDSIVKAYSAGTSVLALSKEYGLTRSTVERILRSRGIAIRGAGEANLLRFARMSEQERRDLARAANEARRRPLSLGPSPPRTQRVLETAVTRSRRRGEGAAQLRDLLVARGLDIDEERPVYGYNVDLAVPPVAVEVLWAKAYPFRRADFLRKTIQLADLGWWTIWVWCSRVLPTAPCADEVVAFHDLAERDPGAVRPQYRVVRSTGELVAGGEANAGQIALVPPPGSSA